MSCPFHDIKIDIKLIQRGKSYLDKPLPHITPHGFRHTFCTNMANSGMDIKTLQYVMGYSEVGVTLNVYTHASYDRAAEQMAKIIDLRKQRGKFAACSVDDCQATQQRLRKRSEHAG